MLLQNVFASFQTRAGISYNLSLAIGAMLATLATVAYADLASTLATERVQIILQGAQIIGLTVAAGVIAGALHVLSTAGESAAPVLARRTAAV
jgi:hypothetical protein